jgi:uncharacterized membrane protein YdjX (TVP38/TMEM64 family)
VRRTAARHLLAIAALLIAGIALWRGRAELAEQLQGFAHWIEGLGPWGPLAFMTGYAAAVVAFVPALPLTLAGGAIFGPFAGVAYVFVAASAGACGGFLVARYAARGAVERRIAGSPRFAAVDRAIADRGLRIAFLLRLSPVFPFTVLNYALGLTRVRFADFALACLGMLPATAAYVYLGSLVGELAGLGGAAPEAAQAGSPWVSRGLSALGLVATLAVIAVVARTAQRALAEVVREEERPGTV